MYYNPYSLFLQLIYQSKNINENFVKVKNTVVVISKFVHTKTARK